MHRAPTPATADELLEHGDGLLELDRDWVVVRVNAAQERATGKARAETLGRVFWEVWPEAKRTRAWLEYHRCMEERVPVEFEDHFAPLAAWFAIAAHPTSTGGVAVFFRDITKRRRAELSVRAERDFSAAVLDTLASLVVVLDPDGYIVRFNRACERATGFAASEVLGKSVFELLIPDGDLDGARTVFRQLRMGDFPNQHRNRWRTRDGAERLLDWSNTAMADERGAVQFIIATGVDITDRELTLEALRESEAAVRAANERLREADRRKDEFLGMLSHELRNPLAPVRNALYILDHARPEGQQARRARDIATRQIAHLTRLVDDLLDVTRIGRGKIELRHEELDLAGLVRRTAEDYRPLMQDRGLDLGLDVPPEPVLVTGDPARLTQVFGNLLNNAAKFTPAGGRVSLSLRAERDRALAHVQDTGPGIAPELLPSVFEPFTQGKQTLARSEGGLGLGLSLVKGLVTLHGGEVAVASGEGTGSDFFVSLPLARAAAEVEPRPEAPAPPAVARTSRHHVLVVDDNHDAAESLGELMQMLGHEVELAFDGPSAIAEAGRTHPDLVLCDLGLPGMDGYQVARELRAREGGALRLVALSGYAQPEDVERAIEAGFDAHVAKPPDPERLASLVEPP